MGHQVGRGTLEEELVEVKQSLSDWRRREKAPKPIPASIWEEAVLLARRHGVGPVAAGLKLDHAKLKAKLAASVGETRPSTTLEPVVPTFVELFGAPPTSTRPTAAVGPCVLRLSSPRGLRVRVDLTNIGTAELATLLKELV